MDYLGWYLIYFLLINVITSEKRFFIILMIFCLASFKLSFFGARSWTMRGFSFTNWGIQGPPGYFMNSGELSIQMLMFAPVALEAALFLRPTLSRIKFGVLMLMPVTAAMTVIGASSRGSQLALVYQFYRSLLKGRLTLQEIVDRRNSRRSRFRVVARPAEGALRVARLGRDVQATPALLDAWNRDDSRTSCSGCRLFQFRQVLHRSLPRRHALFERPASTQHLRAGRYGHGCDRPDRLRHDPVQEFPLRARNSHHVGCGGQTEFVSRLALHADSRSHCGVSSSRASSSR